MNYLKSRNQKMTRGTTQQGFTLIELMIVVVIIGILASIAIPNFFQYQITSRQAESRTNLGSIFISETAFFAINDRFGGLSQIGFSLAGRTNRYTYRAVSTDTTGTATPQAGDVILANAGPTTADSASIPADSSASGFSATATGNLDSDATVDEWYVNDRKNGLEFPIINDALM